MKVRAWSLFKNQDSHTETGSLYLQGFDITWQRVPLQINVIDYVAIKCCILTEMFPGKDIVLKLLSHS